MNHTAEAHTEDNAEEHASLFKTPQQLITAIVLAFIIPVIVILLLVNLVTSGSRIGAGSNALQPEAIASRIQPVAKFTLVDASAPKEQKTGIQVYESTCSACHSAGVAGAPKVGDSGAWAPLIQSGMAEMLKIALEGKGAMPARGGNPGLTDLEIARAVVHMANQSGGSFPEPVEGDSAADAGSAPADAAAAPAAPAAEPAAEPAAPAAEAAPQPAPEPAAPAANDFKTEGDNGATVTSGG